MKKLSYDSIITYGFIVLVAITGIWDFIYRGGVKFPRILLIIATVIGVKLLFKFTFLKKCKMLYVCVIVFIFFSMYLANVLDFYSINGYDKILHFASGFLIGIFGFALYVFLFGIKNKNAKSIAVVIFTITFSIASAGAWEIWEFTTDQLFGLMAQNGLHDTMYDIILGSLSGIIVSIPIYLYTKGKKFKILDKIVKEIED